jgi:acetoacetyl-CoA reductase/3-oxoacyl-[acyl-carrier protein] reductase
VEQTLKKVIQEFPEVSILVNNAGITDDKVFWKMSTEQWQRVLQVNLTGAFWMSRTMARHFRELERGTIVNISSINGLRGKFGQANYSAAKGGLVALTKTMARELGRFHITANCIAPGMVKTPMTDKLDPEINDRAREESPLGEIAQPEQIAQAVLFLCSPWARHITGTVLKVDGGQYI